jgi:small subunit ribosomal protein S16
LPLLTRAQFGKNHPGHKDEEEFSVVKIRLKRVGMKKAPHYRIVVTDSRARRDGSPIEELGYYNPRSKELKLDKEAVTRWMNNGAQPSETVANLIRKAEAAAAS